MFIPSVCVGLDPLSPSPPGCDSTCHLGSQMLAKEKTTDRKLDATKESWPSVKSVCVICCRSVCACVFLFPSFWHCKFSAEQCEGLAHELSDLGVWEGHFHTHAGNHTHTHAWQRACQRRMLMLLQQLFQDWKCVRTELSASPGQNCTRACVYVCVCVTVISAVRL